ncbi:TetR/AcrR family transcriptional regulator [Isoptericola sp. NPDC057559]|uniref:TetR/AcrR family transcriptional regulator n=1 Tax=Isoptericola sp. NPDC057559 TaxID=3346168 RepID=UPI0036818A54
MTATSSHVPPRDDADRSPADTAAGAATMRSDARRNRDRIVAVARRLFAERGLDVPMATVARHAGVGVATLYRRFPTRDDLVQQVFAEQFARCAADVDAATQDPDPWRGFVTAVTRVCQTQAVDRGFSAAFLASVPRAGDATAIGRERDRVFASLAGLVARAQASGALRPDVTLDDLALVVMANDGVVAAAADPTGSASRRLVAVLLGGFRAAPGATPLPPSAGPTLGALISGTPAREVSAPRPPRPAASRPPWSR